MGCIFTILHLSDLHRSEADRISNAELISCLVADRARYAAEVPSISQPDAIVVSGDLVQGLPLDSPDYPNGLQRQYDEALDLLGGLADHFLEGNRSKLIMVPGNHDVDWNVARAAMTVVDPEGKDLKRLVFGPGSLYRWSWKTREVLHISDRSKYDNRFDYYRQMFVKFYEKTDLAFKLNPSRSWNFFGLDGGRILVCAFNSCASNDCYNPVGEISLQDIAEAHIESLAHDPLLKIAVWHHDAQGPPMRSDYMDPDTARLLVDKGFRLGLHGHRHRSDVSPCVLFTSDEHKMAIIGAGSLCAGSSALPTGFFRQYNVIEIADDYQRARVHVREMLVPRVFCTGRLVALGGRSFIDIVWSPPPRRLLVNMGRSGGTVVREVEQIEALIAAGYYNEAVMRLDTIGGDLAPYGRQLMTEALFKAESWDGLARHLSSPQNVDELTRLLRALVELKNWQEAQRMLTVDRDPDLFPPKALKDLGGWLKAEKGARL